MRLICCLRTCFAVNGKVTQRSRLNSFVWSAENGDVVSVACE